MKNVVWMGGARLGSFSAHFWLFFDLHYDVTPHGDRLTRRNHRKSTQLKKLRRFSVFSGDEMDTTIEN